MAVVTPQPGESLSALLRDIITELQNIEVVLTRIAKSIDGGGQQ